MIPETKTKTIRLRRKTMNATQNEMPFATRCKSFFGFLPGQTLQGFASEIRALTDQDKCELVEMFNQAGLPTAMPRNCATISEA